MSRVRARGSPGRRLRVVAVGLGPAGEEMMSVAARRVLEEAPTVRLRTRQHPSASVLPGAESFDAHYEREPTFDAVYSAIVEDLVAAAAAAGWVAYAVPGSPTVAEDTVQRLASDPRVDLEVVPGMSFADLAWASLGIDPVREAVRIVDGEAFIVHAAGERGPWLVAQCWSQQVLSAVKLAAGGEGPRPTVLAHLGLGDEQVFEVDWQDLDRTTRPDHLTSLYVPRQAAAVAPETARLWELVRTLRQRCPWDREQTHESLRRHLLEETYELLEAIDALDGSGESYAHLEEELGDLMFQVWFHSVLAAEEGQFDVSDVARRVHDKLVARHPHVFGSFDAPDARAVMDNWEKLKKAEKGRASVLDGIPTALPALARASKVQRRAEAAGIHVAVPGGSGAEPAGVGADPARVGAGAAGVGAELYALVERARRVGVDAEEALRLTTSEVESAVRGEEAGKP